MGIEASRMQSIVDRRVSRRAFLSGSGVLFSSALGSCGLLGPQGRPGNRRLTARPGQPFLQPDLGESMLGLGSGRDGLIFVPVSYTPAVPLPLLVMLHGATGSSQGMRGLGLAADELGAIVLIPESREYTWDLILGRYGPDVEFIDRGPGVHVRAVLCGPVQNPARGVLRRCVVRPVARCVERVTSSRISSRFRPDASITAIRLSGGLRSSCRADSLTRCYPCKRVETPSSLTFATRATQWSIANSLVGTPFRATSRTPRWTGFWTERGWVRYR